ncbi:MAG: hypothetical protein N2654_01270 [Deltaproteobacteria bacterium]|nr:hypothetical protein [Deltaproteobacteria bacterium]
MPFGNFFGALWFLMLFLAAITSSISMISPVVAFLEEYFHLNSRQAQKVSLFFLTFCNLLVFCFSKDLILLSTLDFWLGTFCVFLFAGCLLLVGFNVGLDVVFNSLKEGALLTVPVFAKVLLAFVAPVFFVGILIAWVANNLPSYLSSVSGFEGYLGISLVAFSFICVCYIVYSKSK